MMIVKVSISLFLLINPWFVSIWRIYSYEIIKHEISTSGMWNPNFRLWLIELIIIPQKSFFLYKITVDNELFITFPGKMNY